MSENPTALDLAITAAVNKIPVEPVPHNYPCSISLLPNSEIPDGQELKLLICYRKYREANEFGEYRAEKIWVDPVYPKIPGSLLATYQFIKYGPDDWAYRGSHWDQSAFPRNPEVRAYSIERYAGPFALAQLLDAVTGWVDVDRDPPAPVASERWRAWLREHPLPGQ